MDESDFIPLHSALKLKKLFSVKKKAIFSKPFPLVLRFFLPPRQDITILTYPDGFCQAQAVWLRKTRQGGLSAPSSCCEENILAHILSGKHHYSWRGRFFDAARFCISTVQREKCLLISIETSVSFVQ